MKRSLNRFLVKVVLFALFVIAGYEVAYRVGLYPVMTISPVFDSKMRQVHEQPVNPRLMGIGSSQTMYGLHSATIRDSLQPAYYNVGCWGLQIADTWVVLRALLEEYHPSDVVLCASVWDFIRMPNPTYSDYSRTPSVIRQYFPGWFYVRNYHPLWSIYQRRFSHRPVIDQWGGATVGALRDRFVPDSDNMTFPAVGTAVNYRALDSMGEYLQRRKVRLVFVQMPIQSRYFAIDSVKGKVAAYFGECRRLVEGRGGVYLNYGIGYVPDSLFMDMVHVDSAGAIVLTRKLVGDLKNIIR